MKRKHIVSFKKFEVIHEIKEGNFITTCFYMFTPRIVSPTCTCPCLWQHQTLPTILSFPWKVQNITGLLR
jgi:hypothetical protein